MTDKTKGVDQSTADEQTAAPVQSHDRRTVDLDVPVLCGNREVTQLVLRRPNAGALRGISLVDIANMDVVSLQRLLPRITEPVLTTAEVAALDLADLTSIGVEVAGFLAKRQDRLAFQ